MPTSGYSKNRHLSNRCLLYVLSTADAVGERGLCWPPEGGSGSSVPLAVEVDQHPQHARRQANEAARHGPLDEHKRTGRRQDEGRHQKERGLGSHGSQYALSKPQWSQWNRVFRPFLPTVPVRFCPKVPRMGAAEKGFTAAAPLAQSYCTVSGSARQPSGLPHLGHALGGTFLKNSAIPHSSPNDRMHSIYHPTPVCNGDWPLLQGRIRFIIYVHFRCALLMLFEPSIVRLCTLFVHF